MRSRLALHHAPPLLPAAPPPPNHHRWDSLLRSTPPSCTANTSARLFLGLGPAGGLSPGADSSGPPKKPEDAHLKAIKDSVESQEAMERWHRLVLWRRTYGYDALLVDTDKAVDSLVASQRDAGDFQAPLKTVNVLGKSYQRLRTDVRQYVVTVWSCMFFLGMVGIASVFVIFDDQAVSDKGTAMTLVFTYAALGWLLSNGMLLSPRYVNNAAVHAASKGVPPPPSHPKKQG